MSDLYRGNLAIAQSVQECLKTLDERVVFAESCTGGEVVSTMTKLSGISRNLCGSFVTYRIPSKRKWLGIDSKAIEEHTAESECIAQEMALGALRETPEANWALGVVGHLGPDAPADKDGHIWVCVVRRTKRGKIKIKDNVTVTLGKLDRVMRQKNATEVCLSTLARNLMHRVKQKDSKKSKKVG